MNSEKGDKNFIIPKFRIENSWISDTETISEFRDTEGILPEFQNSEEKKVDPPPLGRKNNKIGKSVPRAFFRKFWEKVENSFLGGGVENFGILVSFRVTFFAKTSLT